MSTKAPDLNLLIELQLALVEQLQIVENSKSFARILATIIERLDLQQGTIYIQKAQRIQLVASIGELAQGFLSQKDLHDPELEFQQVLAKKECRFCSREVNSGGAVKQLFGILIPLFDRNRPYGIVTLISENEWDNEEQWSFAAGHLSRYLGALILHAEDVHHLLSSEQEMVRLSKFPREAPNPLFCCNNRGDLTYLNQAMLDFLKVNRLGRINNIKELFQDGGKSFSHICRSVGEDIVSKNREFRIGGRIMLGSVSSYRGSDSAYVFLQDITELKNLAQQMARKNLELTEIKEELEFQTRRALDANRHKSEFLANMSHELRTPLNAVIGFSEVLRDELFGPLNDKQKEYSQDILESGRHLLSLINDILDLSKIEAGKMELELSEFSVLDLIRLSLNLMKEKTTKHNIALTVDVDEKITTVTADERKIKQVVFNLVSNALKFTGDNGEISVRVTKEGDFAKFCVSDTGIGISLENQERIFGEFQQADGSMTKKYEGAGLGLAIVKKFVELHGGRVWVESKLNIGSKFYFLIPITSPKWLAASQFGS